MLITLYLIASNVYSSVQGPQKRGFSYIEIWMVGIHFPILLAIFEYGLLLVLQKYFNKESERTEEIEEFGRKLDICTFFFSLAFMLTFNVIYWSRTLT